MSAAAFARLAGIHYQTFAGGCAGESSAVQKGADGERIEFGWWRHSAAV
jgi:hypothetical protein